MRFSTTAMIERNVRQNARFATEPYEAGWAGEGRWFVRVLEGTGQWSAHVEVSPDGQAWCPLGPQVHVEGPGVYTLGAVNFGHWLRLVLAPTGGDGPSLWFHAYLSLKE
ncbi:hypothetical protein ACBJ59_54055 [Nonomuraea sp. MTCD27]|uniref:hypothetical protein n=1 Tax=Nonomuraea sp. MTCD27 TaxID=1676747 RepID=UPI0035C1DFB4